MGLGYYGIPTPFAFKWVVGVGVNSARFSRHIIQNRYSNPTEYISFISNE